MPTELLDLFNVEHRPASTRAVREREYRLDAGFHATGADDILLGLRNSKLPVKKISQLARVFGLTDFGLNRVPADKKQGVPFFTVSSIQEHEPIPTLFLAKAYEPKLADYIVSSGMVLVSRSGTVGNVVIVDRRLEGVAVANHAIRVVAQNPEHASLLYLILSGPIGASLLPNLSYGSVIEQIKSYQLEAISVPLPTPRILLGLHESVQRASCLREQASDLLRQAQQQLLHSNRLPDLVRELTPTHDNLWHIEATEVLSSSVAAPPGESEYRLQATFYAPAARAAIANIQACASPKSTVGKLSRRLFVSNRFSRTYVDKKNGIPFLSGANIVQVRPSGLKFISRTETEGIDEQRLEKGWVLTPRAGTLGRFCLIHENFEECIASDNILRIVPDETVIDSGYLLAFLSSQYGYEQVMRYRNGSVIDYITPEQVAKFIVPVATPAIQKEIGDKVRLAYEKRADALKLEDQAQEILQREITGKSTKEILGDV
jgi:type I restriction enzyme S subunit